MRGFPKLELRKLITMYEWCTGILLCPLISQYDVVTTLTALCLGEGKGYCCITGGTLKNCSRVCTNAHMEAAAVPGLQPRTEYEREVHGSPGKCEGFGVVLFSNALCHYRKL